MSLKRLKEGRKWTASPLTTDGSSLSNNGRCAIIRPLPWSGIEVVITGLTRNQLVGFTGTWVRIPPAPHELGTCIIAGAFPIAWWDSPVRSMGKHSSAISVGTAGIADASTRCLLRLTRSGHFRFQQTTHWATVSLTPHRGVTPFVCPLRQKMNPNLLWVRILFS